MAKFLAGMSIGIIDEGPMLDRLLYEAIDNTIEDFVAEEHNEKKFGGKIILISGDFRQLLPVIKKANRSTIVNQTIKKSRLWDDVQVLKLTQNMRVQNEKISIQMILNFMQSLKIMKNGC